MKLRALAYLPAILLTALGTSCENEVDLNAPPKDITAAYGVLNAEDSIHYVKVNKSFLPEGNAQTYAEENYSKTYYENVSVSVLELNEDGGTERNFTLQDTMVQKEEGLFEHDEPQKLYYFEAADLAPEHRYKLRILIDEGEKSEKKVEGSTELVGDITLSSHNAGQNFGNQFYFYSGGEYRTEEVEWTEVENAADHRLLLRIHYENIFGNGDTIQEHIDWQVGRKDRGATNVKVDGRSFYRRLSTELTPNPNGLKERRMNGLELLFRAADQEMKTYTTVAGPSASIVQQRTRYTNLDTAAVGIFASARHERFRGLTLNDNSLDQLIEGEITSDLKFTY